MNTPLIVAKVGGSLYDLPDLAARLRGWIASRQPSRLLLFPGGGSLADAIRRFDEVHGLGEETSHWLAIEALSLAARFLGEVLPEARLLPRIPDPSDGRGPFILDPLPFFRKDEDKHGRMPHQWNVTSDSLAVRVAACAWAAELVLLKSVAYDSTDVVEASKKGVVDPYFPMALNKASDAPAVCRFRTVNLRQWPNAHSAE
jgi:aspartokinase-like uncharacterized kinase